MDEKAVRIPELNDPRWRKVLLGEPPPAFRHLVSQLMFSRIKMTIESDQSEAALSAAANSVRDFFVKNQIKISDDVTSLLRYMEVEK